LKGSQRERFTPVRGNRFRTAWKVGGVAMFGGGPGRLALPGSPAAAKPDNSLGTRNFMTAS
jgi:hypothetical protein